MQANAHSWTLSDGNRRQRIRRRLLTWFQHHARDLPWRRTSDPYRIWVSEIMLQQTQVATVVPYYERFVRRFPDVRTLAAADEDDVLRLWEGLGYYRRARQLHQAARVVVAAHDGQFPRDAETAQRLPGIGRYTAGAILSIAFDARQPILEANTKRVLSRLIAYRDDLTRSAGQRVLWQAAERLLPRKNVGAMNQAWMELGSEVCRPQDPLCDACPLHGDCAAAALGLQTAIPLPKPKTNYENRREASVVVRHRGRVLLRRCGPDERWAGLWDFPRFPVDAPRGAALLGEVQRGVDRLTGIATESARRIATLKHGVTRYRITLMCFEASFAAGRLRKQFGEMKWIAATDLTEYPLSVTGRRISELIR